MTPPNASNPTLRRCVWPFIIAGAIAMFAALFLKLADSVRETDFVVRADQHTLNFILDHRADWISRVARLVTQVGSTWVVTVVIVVAATILLRRHRYLDAGFVAVSSIGTAILVAIAKQIIGRPRPAVSHRRVAATGAAFPSGHAAQSVACYGALAVIVVIATRRTKIRWSASLGAVTIALIVGTSRVYLGVHWPSDVVSGWLLASGWLLMLIGVRLFFSAASSTPRSRPCRVRSRNTRRLAR
jgi:undecaprenyl-diphosphatase